MWSVICFAVRVSVMFHSMFVHYPYSSVWVAEWPPFWEIAARSVSNLFSLFFVICNIYLFPAFVLRAGFAFCLPQ